MRATQGPTDVDRWDPVLRHVVGRSRYASVRSLAEDVQLHIAAFARQCRYREVAFLLRRRTDVRGVASGVIDTPLLAGLNDEMRESLAANVPFPKRLGTPQDYAQLVVSVLQNGYINGETIRMDGALRMAPR